MNISIYRAFICTPTNPFPTPPINGKFYLLLSGGENGQTAYTNKLVFIAAGSIASIIQPVIGIAVFDMNSFVNYSPLNDCTGDLYVWNGTAWIKCRNTFHYYEIFNQLAPEMNTYQFINTTGQNFVATTTYFYTNDSNVNGHNISLYGSSDVTFGIGGNYNLPCWWTTDFSSIPNNAIIASIAIRGNGYIAGPNTNFSLKINNQIFAGPQVPTGSYAWSDNLNSPWLLNPATNQPWLYSDLQNISFGIAGGPTTGNCKAIELILNYLS